MRPTDQERLVIEKLLFTTHKDKEIFHTLQDHTLFPCKLTNPELIHPNLLYLALLPHSKPIFPCPNTPG
jgi:hypothetical protein